MKSTLVLSLLLGVAGTMGMAQSPGTVRWKYRQMVNALVYQALVD